VTLDEEAIYLIHLFVGSFVRYTLTRKQNPTNIYL